MKVKTKEIKNKKMKQVLEKFNETDEDIESEELAEEVDEDKESE
jgi:hypothetical protein